jgi:hypothetical protein
VTDDIRALLQENLKGMRKSLAWLKRSHEKCSRIGVKQRYREDEFDDFENMVSRYARTLEAIPELFAIAERTEKYCERFAKA